MWCDVFGWWCAASHAAPGAAPEIDGAGLRLAVALVGFGLLLMKGRRR
jgi:hypothetical protein